MRITHAFVCSLLITLTVPASAATLVGNVQVVSTGAEPQDACIADFTGDGLPDIATANWSGRSMSVLVGQPDGRFGVATAISTGSAFPKAISAGDFTGDGFVDIAVCVDAQYSALGSMWLYSGDGQAQFQRIAVVPIGYSLRGMDAKDIDGDGALDAAVASYRDTVFALFNQGNGSSWSVIGLPMGGDASGVALGDVDRDGDIDIVGSSHFLSTVGVFANAGGRSFAPRQNYDAGYEPFDVAVGDVTGDEWPDIVVPNYDGFAVTVLKGSATGFSTPVAASTTGWALGVTVGDLTRDGIGDIVVSEEGYYDDTDWSCFVQSAVRILTFVGGDSLRTFQELPCGNQPYDVVLADLDGDNMLDLVTPNDRSSTVTIWKADPVTGAFSRESLAVGSHPLDLAYGDLTGDSLDDVVVANGYASSFTVLLCEANGVLQSYAEIPTDAGPSAIAMADMDSDGHVDVLVTSATMSTLTVFRGYGDGTFAAGVSSTVGAGPVGLAIGDVNEDGRPDVVTSNLGTYNDGCWCYQGGNTLSVLLGRGDGTFDPRLDVPSHSGPGPIILDRFNVDSHLDIAVATPGGYSAACDCFSGSKEVGVFFGDGQGHFPVERYTAVGLRPVALVAGDLGGSTARDMIVAQAGDWDYTCGCYAQGTIRLFEGRGDGTFSPESTLYVGASPSDVVAADVTADGLSDLIVTAYVGNSVSVLPGVSAGRFGPVESYGTGSSPLAVVVPDLGGDDRLDVVTADSYSSSVSILRNALSQPVAVGEPGEFTPRAGSISFVTRRGAGGVWVDVATSGGDPPTVAFLTVSGGMVWSELAKPSTPGVYAILWPGVDREGKPVASGIYLCRVSNMRSSSARRILYLR